MDTWGESGVHPLDRDRDEIMKEKHSGKPGAIVDQDTVMKLSLRDGAPAKKLENALTHVVKLLVGSSKGPAFDQDLF